VAHVAPWKFARGRCLHRHMGGRGAEWPGHHGGHHHGDHHGPGHHHGGDRPRHHGPFAPLLSWLPFAAAPPPPRAVAEQDQESDNGPRMLVSLPFFGHTRAMLGRFMGGASADGDDSTATTENAGSKMTESTQTDEHGTTTTKEIKGKNSYFRMLSFRSNDAK